MSVCVDQREKLLKFFCQINLSFGVLVQILRGHCLAYEYVYPPVTSVLCDVLITLCTCNQSLTQSLDYRGGRMDWKRPYILIVNLAYRARPGCIEILIHGFVAFGSFLWLASEFQKQ